MKYSIITFGCRVNQADSLEFEERLGAAGASAAPPEEADLVIVNTCSVTASADQGARQTIRRVVRQNPNARVVVTGCYATRRPSELADLPNVVRIVNNENKARLVPLLRADGLALGRTAETPSECSTAERFGDGEGSCGLAIAPGVAGRTAFTLRVQTGCSEPCAYCIIPSTRGRPLSAPVSELVAETQRISAAGFKEIALTGVHLGSYGRDLAPSRTLTELLRALAAVARAHDSDPGLLFRISSLEPMDCTTELVDLVASAGCFAPHFHLPLQHASDRVLRRMRRPYSAEQYAAIVDHIRARMPSASIGSDVIVGFPGETDGDFDDLVRYLGRSPLTHVHVFPYSDRPGTAASVMTGKVLGTTIRERARRIREISERLTASFRASQAGTVHRALTLDDGSLAVTGNYLKVRIAPAVARNQWINVRVRQVGTTLLGEIC